MSGNFLIYCSLEIFNFLPDGREQQGASFCYAKAQGNMFQRKVEKLEKYLPYFFHDWTITYMYSCFLKYLTWISMVAQ